MTIIIKRIAYAAFVVAAAYVVYSTPAHGQQPTKPNVAKNPVAAAAQTATPVTYDPLGPIPSPLDQRMVRLTYEPNSAINILALAGQHVHIKLAPDEQIVTVQTGDRIRWKVEVIEEEGLSPRLFIKPTQVNLATTMTVVTSIPQFGGSRSYEFLLQSVPEGGRFYRQVTFDYPDIRDRESRIKRAAAQKSAQENDRLAAHELTPPLSVDSLNWGYEIEGKAAFRPDVVFDDGRFIHIRIPPSVQEWPAVFLLADKQMQYVQVVRKGELLVVQRLAPSLLLKLGDAEVRIHRKDARPRGFFGG